MGVMEIVLLVGGVILAGVSFLIPAKGDEVPGETKKLAQDEIKTMVDQQMDEIRHHVDDVVDEAVGYAVEKTERSLERLTNEKIMAVNEYSDTVLNEIHKNHEEAVFLYDMLNNKQTGLKNMVSDMNKAVQEAEEITREAEAAVNSFRQLEAENAAARSAAQIPEPAPVRKLSGLERLLAGNDKGNEEKGEPATVPPRETASAVSAGMPRETVSAGNVPPIGTGTAANAGMSAGTASEIPADPVRPAVDLSFVTAGEDAETNNNDKILRLYRQGKSKVAIAKELGLGVGEVKLVIDLYKSL
ncbi:MAG: DUF6115 domain-containing protein [Clostridium sp.]|nr:DUF6115 domain-containing protein [Acetatifactor muris]MCM1525985.1 DUF6115 domain-containing protein [Bacteroides sp.]MCM1562255.1 DUF6115 domain-containing protein [Clostridium sp.]